MNMILTTASAAVVAAMTVAAVAHTAFAPFTSMRYELVQTFHDDLYVLDHDLTARDCDDAMRLNAAYPTADATYFCRVQR